MSVYKSFKPFLGRMKLLCRIHFRNAWKHYKNVKIPPIITLSVFYYISWLSS